MPDIPEVEGALHLAEAGPRHDTDPGLLQQLEAVEHIWLEPRSLWKEHWGKLREEALRYTGIREWLICFRNFNIQ